MHVNNNVVDFLNHFKADRLIRVICEDPDKNGRKRSESEKAKIHEECQKQREEEKEIYDKLNEDRDTHKQNREVFKEKVLGVVNEGRNSYKEQLAEAINKRNGYREMIMNRKAMEKALVDLLAQEKIDLNALQGAIDAASEAQVK